MINDRAEYAEIMQRILKSEANFSSIKKEINENDKAFANMLIMTAFRQLIFIRDEVLPQFVKKKIPTKQQILNYILYLGTTELLFLNTPDYAVINSYVEAAKFKTDKFGANFVNAVLRNILRNKDKLLDNRKSKYFSREFLQILKQDYSASIISKIEDFANIEPALDLSLKKDCKLQFDEAIILPSGSVRLPANTHVTELNGYKDGCWWVQDAASALPVKCLGDIKGKHVLDLCAAPGGKTTQLLDDGAIVTAVDISESRLATLKENMKRLNLTENLNIVCADALSYSPKQKYDIILLDAPCSATGTFRRHPEILHIKTLADVKKQAVLQQKILEHAATLLCKDGKLMYTTCSLAKAEGEQQVNHFIKKHDNFSVIPLEISGTENMRTKEGFLRIIPQCFAEYGGIDGFFIACLQRNN